MKWQKVRKGSRAFEALQVKRENITAVNTLYGAPVFEGEIDPPWVELEQADGSKMVVLLGDYLLKSLGGQIIHCKREVFDKKFRPRK